MAREVHVYFGGADRRLYLDARDAIEIKRRLGKKPRRVLDEDLACEIVGADGKATGKISAYEVDLHSLAVVLQLAISHIPGTNKRDETLTYDVVLDWISEYIETETVLTLVQAVADELHISGVMGLALDIEALKKRIADASAAVGTIAEEAEGKERTRSEESPKT